MSTINQTRVTEFILLGFGNLQNFGIIVFILFLLIFLFTIIGNLMLIVLVSVNTKLQSPMYYFLCHLSISDLVISTNIVPNMLGAILFGEIKMTFIGCITQLYFFSGTTFTECYLLSVMSYDRYLAICNPLRYSSIMDFKHQVFLSVWPWLLGFTFNLPGVLPISNFIFCHDNVIDHVFCDVYPLQKLSCSDTSVVELRVFLFSMPIFVLPCSLIIVTYVYIFHTIFKIPSTTGKKKTFSTCSSHLILVWAYYGTLIAKYMIPSVGHSVITNKNVSILHTLLTPLLNPIIYSFRNRDIKMAFRKLLKYSSKSYK